MQNLGDINSSIEQVLGQQAAEFASLVEEAESRAAAMQEQFLEAVGDSRNPNVVELEERLAEVISRLGSVAAIVVDTRGTGAKLLEVWGAVGSGSSTGDAGAGTAPAGGLVKSPDVVEGAEFIPVGRPLPNAARRGGRQPRRIVTPDAGGETVATDSQQGTENVAAAAVDPSAPDANRAADPAAGRPAQPTAEQTDGREEYPESETEPPAMTAEEEAKAAAGWSGPVGEIRHEQLDDVLSAAMANGGYIPDTVILQPNDAAMLRGGIAIMQRNLDRQQHPGRVYNDKTMPREMPGMNVISDSLEQGQTSLGLLLAAEALEGKPRNRNFVLRAARSGVTRRLRGTIFAPDIIVDTIGGRGERRLRGITNKIIETAYGSKFRRNNGPSAGPMLIARAICIAGENQGIDSRAAASLAEGFRRAWEKNRKIDGGFPPDVQELSTDIYRAWGRGIAEARRRPHRPSHAGRRTIRKRLSGAGAVNTEPINEELSGVAQKHHVRVKALREKRRQDRLAKRDTEYNRDLERRERLDHAKQASLNYNQATTLSTTALSARARRAIRAGKSDEVIEDLMALQERKTAGSRAAAVEFDRLWARTSRGLVEAAHEQRKRIAAGYITPGMASFISGLSTNNLGRDWALREKIEGLKTALEELAFVSMDMPLEVKSKGKNGEVKSYHPGLYDDGTRNAIVEGHIYRLKQRGVGAAIGHAPEHAPLLAALDEHRSRRLVRAARHTTRLAIPRIVAADVNRAQQLEAHVARTRRLERINGAWRWVVETTNTVLAPAALKSTDESSHADTAA